MFLNMRVYIEAAVAALLISGIVFLKIDLAVKEHTIASKTIEISKYKSTLETANTLISTQNQAVEALHIQADANEKLATQNLQKVQVQTKIIYKQADAISATTGSTCEDAMNLLNEQLGVPPQ